MSRPQSSRTSAGQWHLLVQLLPVPDRPNTEPAAAVLRPALDEVGLTAVPITTRIIYTQAEPDRLGFPGSPTILIDGRDPAKADRGSSTVRGRVDSLTIQACPTLPTADATAVLRSSARMRCGGPREYRDFAVQGAVLPMALTAQPISWE